MKVRLATIFFIVLAEVLLGRFICISVLIYFCHFRKVVLSSGRLTKNNQPQQAVSSKSSTNKSSTKSSTTNSGTSNI